MWDHTTRLRLLLAGLEDEKISVDGEVRVSRIVETFEEEWESMSPDERAGLSVTEAVEMFEEECETMTPDELTVLKEALASIMSGKPLSLQ